MNNAMLLYAHFTDKELVDTINAGNKHGFEVLVRRYGQVLYRIARIYTIPPCEAKDQIFIQFTEAFQNLKHYKPAISFPVWLTKKMIDKCQQANVMVFSENVFEPAATEMRTEENCRKYYQSSHRSLSPDYFETCIDRLPVVLRSVYVLCDIIGFNDKDIQHLLDISSLELHTRLEKAKSVIQELAGKPHLCREIYQLYPEAEERLVYFVMAHIGARINGLSAAPAA